MATEEVGIRIALRGRREASTELAQATSDVTEVGDAAEAAGRKAERSARRWSRFRSVTSSIGRGARNVIGVLGAVTVAASVMGLKTAAAMENAKIGFTTMLGSGRRARKFLGELERFAAKTPFEFPELQTAASSLVSSGIQAKKVIPIMTTLGDVTAGMGTGSEGIKRATVALQQMNAAQKISAEDLNQLRDAGIPVYDLLAGAMGKTKQEISALRDEGKLGGDALAAMMRALETGKGLERFNGLMDKQSRSLNGSWSTLKDTVQMGLAKAIKPALPLVKDLLGVASDFAERAMPTLRRGVKGVVGAIRDTQAAYKKGGMKAALGSLSSSGAAATLTGLADGFSRIGIALAAVDWAGVRESVGEGTVDTLNVFAVVVGFAADHVDLLATAMPWLAAGFIAYKTAQLAANVAAAADVPVRLLQVFATRSLDKSMKSLAVSQAAAMGTTVALTGAATGQAGATTGAAVAQRGLNMALIANPIGLVIAAVALLVVGFILLYKKSDTFRGIVDTLWGALKKLGSFVIDVFVGYLKLMARAWLTVGIFGVKAFRMLLKGAFMAFDGILSAAEKGLGWIKGIGGKIKGARAAFDDFGDKTISKLDKLEDKLKDTQKAIDGVARDRSATITINATMRRSGAPDLGADEVAGMRAKGGPVTAGRSYVVGEHRPELFTPKTSGMILPSVPDLSSLADLDVSVGPDFPGGRTVVARLVLPDGREIFEWVLEEADEMVGRE